MAETEAVQDNQQTAEDLNELMKVRREKMDKIAAQGIEPFGRKYDFTHHAQTIIEQYAQLEGQTVRIAGRLMAVRGHGKASFGHVMDMTGKIQVYFRQDVLGETAYEQFRLLDIGDLVGIEGVVFTTQKGEISIKAISFEFLAKTLRPLPEKWHGLKDVETRYRQRYLRHTQQNHQSYAPTVG